MFHINLKLRFVIVAQLYLLFIILMMITLYQSSHMKQAPFLFHIWTDLNLKPESFCLAFCLSCILHIFKIRTQDHPCRKSFVSDFYQLFQRSNWWGFVIIKNERWPHFNDLYPKWKPHTCAHIQMDALTTNYFFALCLS